MSMEKIPFTAATGFYRGKVVSHLPGGQCKIWIEAAGWPATWETESSSQTDIYGNQLRGAKYPTANQAAPLGGGFCGNGIFCYPQLSSYVWCFFENGDENKPIYFATDPRGPTTESQYSEVAKSDPNDNTYMLKFGNSTIEIGNNSIQMSHQNSNINSNTDEDQPSKRFTIQIDDTGINIQDNDNNSFVNINTNGYINISTINETSKITLDNTKITIDANEGNVSVNGTTGAVFNARGKDAQTVIGNETSRNTVIYNPYNIH